ncbi:MRN complex-interacting protein [Pararge aegeria]|uniref:Jg23786 protein n=1 Tax=Pararge aegeria aegeria TaxID=348720 RepID=A0A8S4SQ25_9NEOP|nr:MRN complex-interacting protein [Pararge aegeria]CAH2268763.1 jg23786 [Pararge aegeria aegeria]
MPQVFQVLRCYKCSIFQVHQTRKDNKWKCKVCGEKQSLKRHYNIGTAKDCRIHVQKLNNMRGDIMETLKLKADSDSDFEDDTENNTKIISTQVLANNTKKESKWTAYIEKEEIVDEKDPEYIDNIEVCLELPNKRKINTKTKRFKVPKVSNNNDCYEKTNIMNNLSTLNSDEINSFNLKNNCTITYTYDTSSVNNNLESSRAKKDVNKSANFQTNKASKWAQYENSDHFEDTENDRNYTIENKEYFDDHRPKIVEYNNPKKEKNTVYNEQKYIRDGNEKINHFLKTEIDTPPLPNKPIFALCDDDSDLDKILDF